jgi:hypothetical protein
LTPTSRHAHQFFAATSFITSISRSSIALLVRQPGQKMSNYEPASRAYPFGALYVASWNFLQRERFLTMWPKRCGEDCKCLCPGLNWLEGLPNWLESLCNWRSD